MILITSFGKPRDLAPENVPVDSCDHPERTADNEHVRASENEKVYQSNKPS